MAIITQSVGLQRRGAMDNMNAPVACYSVDRLWGGWMGAALTLERASDSARIDVGFTDIGTLDLASALAFCGAGGNGFVSCWYDQSGNNNHLVQPVRANQPQLVLNGITFAVGTKTGIIFNGVQGGMKALNAPMTNTDEMFLLLAYKENWSGVGTGAFDLTGDTTNRAFAHMPWSNANIYWDLGNANGPGANWRINALDPVAIGTPKIVSFSHSRINNSKQINVNGAAIATGISTNPSVPCSQLGIGYQANYGIGLAGFLSEFWLYDRFLPIAEQSRVRHQFDRAMASKFSRFAKE
jgi:Alpha-L-arabinofuranosidase B, catalytic